MARLLQLSDLHMVAPGERVSNVLDTPRLLRTAIDTLLDWMDAIGPIDAVLVTGDISDDGSQESYAAAWAELSRLAIRLLAIPGNHDRRSPLRSIFADLPGMAGDGPIDWQYDIGNTRIVGLDTLVEGQSGGRLRPESLDFLGKSIETATQDSMIVALHHPPLRTGIRFMDAIGLENADDLVSVIAPCSKSIQVIAGHVHGVYHGSIGQHRVSTAPSVCSAFAMDRRQDAPIGFMTSPTGCALIDTGPDGVWTELPLSHGAGPYSF